MQSKRGVSDSTSADAPSSRKACTESRPTPYTTTSGSVYGLGSTSGAKLRGFPSTSTRGLRTPASASAPLRMLTGSNRPRTPCSRGTPYTVSSSTPAREVPSVVVALVEGRGLAKGEIGMASIDLKKPTLELAQFSDSQTYHKVLTKLLHLRPVEVVMPSTACEGGGVSTLYEKIAGEFPDVCLATVQRKYFNESKGLQCIKQLCLPELCTVEMEVRSKYYSLASAAALLKYVQFIQNHVYAPASLRVVCKGGEQTAMIDMWTCANLELLQNTRDTRSEHTLFGVLNFTKTAMGARLLRSSILQPPARAETVETRLDAVQELIEREELFYSLQAVLSRFLDVDHLLSLCVQMPKQESMKTSENKIVNMICLKHTLELVQPLREALVQSNNPMLRAFHHTLADPRYEIVLSKINSVIHEDTHYQKGAFHMRMQKCFAVRNNLNGLLDISRKVYMELIDEIADYVQQLSDQHHLGMRTGYNSTRGFHIQLHCGGKKGQEIKKEDLPNQFIKVSKLKNTLSFTTVELIRYNERIKWALHEIYLMTNVVVTELLSNIREQLGCIYNLTDCVAMLDMLVSFAHNCTLSEYVRPDLTDTLAIKQSRHPILDKISVDPPVPNDVYASAQTNFTIISGPNMSGKSTYLRQIALLQIMAQIGSFVPADYASFRICEQIFSRVGSDDDIETNSSTFMLEMKEMNYIIQNTSQKALIIIDELGRGTSAEEGVGICYAVCESLLNTEAFTFFATHFLRLTSLGELYSNVENYHFEVQRSGKTTEGQDGVYYTHVLCKGTTPVKHYGIQLAEVSILPREIVSSAKDLVQRLAEHSQAGTEIQAEEKRQRTDLKLAKCLLQAAANSRLDTASLVSYLSGLRAQYIRELQSSATVRDQPLPKPRDTLQPIHGEGHEVM